MTSLTSSHNTVDPKLEQNADNVNVITISVADLGFYKRWFRFVYNNVILQRGVPFRLHNDKLRYRTYSSYTIFKMSVVQGGSVEPMEPPWIRHCI